MSYPPGVVLIAWEADRVRRRRTELGRAELHLRRWNGLDQGSWGGRRCGWQVRGRWVDGDPGRLLTRLGHGAADDWIGIEWLRRGHGQADDVAAGGEARRLGRVLRDDVRHAAW